MFLRNKFLSVPVATDGTFSMLTLGEGAGNAATNKYIFSSDVVAVRATNIGSHIATGKVGRRAFGNASVGIFTPTGSASASEYKFATDTETTVGFTMNSLFGYAAGNASIAIMGSSYVTTAGPTNRTMQYTYSSRASVESTNLTGVMQLGAAAGTKTFGIFALGGEGTGSGLGGTSKFNYADKTTEVGINLGANLYRGSATGNGDIGIFTLGGDTTPGTTGTVKYTYASHTATSHVALTDPQYFGAASSISTTGLFAVASNKTNKYTYASDTRITGTALTLFGSGSSTPCGAAANGTLGVTV